MTTAEKINYVQAKCGDDLEATSGLVTAYLSDAEDAILSKLYPFRNSSEQVILPPQYEILQCKLALRYLARRGGEGELAHSENGVARTYASADDSDLLDEVMTYVKVCR